MNEERLNKMFTHAEALIRLARDKRKGSIAWGSYGGGKDKGGAEVLVATDANPERLALLRAIHNTWYPPKDDK